MFAINPFAALSATVPTGVMQTYVVIMIVLVAAGTLFDIVHKGSAKYFFINFRKSRGKPVGGGELVAIGVKTAVVDVLASGEFCSTKRRIAHLLAMYGFVLHVVSTVVMVFNPSADSAVGPHLWWIGGLMVLVGGYWFWFFIRVDVAAEGSSPFRVMRADLFILSLLASVTLGLHLGLVRRRQSGSCSSAFTSSRRRCCSARCRGPSSRTCSSSPPRRSRSGLPRPMAPTRTCRR